MATLTAGDIRSSCDSIFKPTRVRNHCLGHMDTSADFVPVSGAQIGFWN